MQDGLELIKKSHLPHFRERQGNEADVRPRQSRGEVCEEREEREEEEEGELHRLRWSARKRKISNGFSMVFVTLKIDNASLFRASAA